MKKTQLDKSNRVGSKQAFNKINNKASDAEKPSIIKLGLDVSLGTVVVVRQIDGQTPQPAQKFTSEWFLKWIHTQLATGAKVYSVYEAGPFGFSLHRRLASLGVENVVVCPQDLDERGKGVKTDGIDAKVLCVRLDRYVNGNHDSLAVVRIPSEEEEKLRAINRQRDQLIKARKQLESQGKSLLLFTGITAPNNWWRPSYWAMKRSVWPDWVVARLEVWKKILDSLHQEILTLTNTLRERACAPVPKGLGSMTVVSLAQEVGDWNRFNNRREVASFCGLCPRQYSSGTLVRFGSITKHGSPRLRQMLIELAWRLFQFQPDYIRLVRWKQKMASGFVNKNKMIVALSRQVAIDLWRLHTGRTTAEALGLAF